MGLVLCNYIDNIKIPNVRSYYILRSHNTTVTNIGLYVVCIINILIKKYLK